MLVFKYRIEYAGPGNTPPKGSFIVEAEGVVEAAAKAKDNIPSTASRFIISKVE
jgi:hypothetical protein